MRSPALEIRRRPFSTHMLFSRKYPAIILFSAERARTPSARAKPCNSNSSEVQRREKVVQAIRMKRDLFGVHSNLFVDGAI